MINARPKALIAIAVAIGSFIIATQTLAECKLQTQSVVFQGKGRVEYIRSEVVVRPTLDDNQQPIPHSFTTTYPGQAPATEGYDAPSKGFTDVLSEVDNSVSSIDLFKTDENGVAKQYTKVLKVGDENVFRFTHNLEEGGLFIEIRKEMTSKYSIKFVRNQLGVVKPLEPLTKVASPEQLAGVLNGANDRAGMLGDSEDYVFLARVKVAPVEVNGRTFMRLITSDDQPPDPERLGQSIFVNDEALFAAATSAYAQAYFLENELQQEVLDELLSYHQPVGYVVHVKDDTQAYPVPTGYPKLEVYEAPGDVIVFHGQKQNPTDIAFVQRLIDFREQIERAQITPVTTEIKTNRVKSYQYIIRSKQMALLEEFAAELTTQHDAQLSKDKLKTLAYYESLQQALESATPDALDKFEFKSAHIRLASWIMTPDWIRTQLEKCFSFKPALRNLLVSQHFVQKFTPLITGVAGDAYDSDEQYTSKIIGTMTEQLIELESKLETLHAKETNILQLREQLDGVEHEMTYLSFSELDKLKANQVSQRLERELAKVYNEMIQLYNQLNFLKQQAKITSVLEHQIRDARKTHNAEAAAPATASSGQEAIQDQASRLEYLENELERIRTMARPEVLKKLGAIEKALKINDQDNENDVYHRRQIISEQVKKDLKDISQQIHGEAQRVLKIVEEVLEINVNEGDTNAERLDKIRAQLVKDDDVTMKMLTDADYMIWEEIRPEHETKNLKIARLLARLNFHVEDADHRIRAYQDVRLKAVESELGIDLSEKDQDVKAKLIRQLKLEYMKDASLTDQKYALEDGVLSLIDKVEADYIDESAKRSSNNKIARQLEIENYESDAPVKDQILLIKVKLEQLLERVDTIGRPDNNERITAIDAELDRQVARLGAKPRYAFDLELARVKSAKRIAENELKDIHLNTEATAGKLPEARQKYDRGWKFLHERTFKESMLRDAQTEEEQAQEQLKLKSLEIDNTQGACLSDSTKLKHQRELLALALNQKKEKTLKAQKALAAYDTSIKAIEDDLDLKSGSTDNYEERINTLKAKLVELGGDDGTGGRILQLAWEQSHLKKELEVKQTEIETLNKALQAAEADIKNEGTPCQYSPKQADIQTDMQAFTQGHSLRKQALEAAIGLAESAKKSGKLKLDLQSFDLNDEFASIRLKALAPDDLTFDQAIRILEVFKKFKQTAAPETLAEQPLNPLAEVQNLADRARAQIGKGAEEYDREIQRMGETAIHFVGHEPKDLKSFSDYLASHSASGNKIIHLLAEGLISKSELEHYLKAVRGVDGYQTVAEFEHFLGYKHGVDVSRFKTVVQLLSDQDVEAFMQRAFTPVTVTATGPMAMQESIAGMTEYSTAVIANYVLDDIAFENGRKTAAFLTNVQDTLTPYANAAGLSESDLITIIHSTLMQAHAAAIEHQLHDYWLKPSAFLVQAVTWYYSSYKPLLATDTAWQAAEQSLSNMAFLYLLDLTHRGDYLHRMLTPFQNWLERYDVDLDRTSQYAYHSVIEQTAEIGGLVMPAGKAASSFILLKTGSTLFARQYNANPHMYRSIFRLVPEIVKSMASKQGIQVPLLHRATPEKVKTLASATAGLVLGPIATVGAYTHGLVSGFTRAQNFGLVLASTLAFDFFMNDNKMLTQWLGGPLGRALDRLNRWRGVGEKDEDYVKRTAVATPQYLDETDEEYANHVKETNLMHGWTRQENYLQFRERRDRTMKLYEDGWEKYFRENVPKWSFSHAESTPYSYTLGVFFKPLPPP